AYRYTHRALPIHRLVGRREFTSLVFRAAFAASHSFFFAGPHATQLYTLSLHDALPIYRLDRRRGLPPLGVRGGFAVPQRGIRARSEEHTSELQSRGHLVCRILLEKKKNNEYAILTFALRDEQRGLRA